MSNPRLLPIDCANPLNWQHPLVRGTGFKYQSIPGLMGGALAHELSHLNPNGVLTTFTIPPWSGTDRPGGYGQLNFDGNTSNIPLSTTPIVFSAQPFSVAAWVHLNDLTTQLYPMVVTLAADNGFPFQIFLSAQAAYLGINIGSSSTWPQLRSNQASTALVGQWLRVLVTYNGQGPGTSANFAIYMNGQAIPLSTSNAFGSLTNRTVIGATPGLVANKTVYGALDDIWLWQGRMLSPRMRPMTSVSRAADRRGF